jgi:hypothetical protein
MDSIEVRHKSWFDNEAYKLLSDNSICLARNQLDAIQTLAERTLYICAFLETDALMKKILAGYRKTRLRSSDCGHILILPQSSISLPSAVKDDT